MAASPWQPPTTTATGVRAAIPDTPVGRLANDLARDLHLLPVSDPFLAKCLVHFVGTVHPTIPAGGMLLFDMMATISRAVLDASVAKYGQVNPEDEAVICGGSPVRLLNYYRTRTPDQRFNEKVTLEGGMGKDGDAHDAWFVARNAEFEAHLLTRRFMTDAAITTLAVMKAIPARLLAGLSEEEVRAVGDEIAAALTAQGFPVNLLSHSEVRSLVSRTLP
ncbi:MAG: hypothetical protein ABGY75_19130 [Gemmataceae bacterium]